MLQGTLDAVGLENLLQMLLKDDRLSGLLTVTRGKFVRTLHVATAGLRLCRPAAAEVAVERAREVILELFHWPHASFEFVANAAVPETSSALLTSEHVVKLLFDVARRNEDIVHFRRTLADFDAVPAWTSDGARRKRATSHPEDLEPVSDLVDGRRRLGEVCADSPLSLFRTLRVLHQLHQGGCLALRPPRAAPVPPPPPPPPEAHVVWKHRVGESSVDVLMDPSKVRAYLRLQGPRPDPEALLADLHSSQLRLLDGLEARLASGDLQNLLISEGKAAKRGSAGDVRWTVDWSSEKAQVHFVDDQADYYEVQTIVQVAPGEEIGEVVPPGPGEDGVDVFGRPIPGPTGTKADVRPGDNIEFDGVHLRSLISGRARRDGPRVWVDPIFRVTGDLDFHTGNVRFAGDVVITGSVLDGFEIDAMGSIVVLGSVFASRLTAGKDILVREGVNGHGRAVLFAGGFVETRHVNASVVHSRGDLKVYTEILHSTVQAGGRVRIPGGAIIGGRAVGRGGVEAAVLGSPMGTPTRIAVGPDADFGLHAPARSDTVEHYRTPRPMRREDIERQFAELARFNPRPHETEPTERPVEERDPRVSIRRMVHGRVDVSIGEHSTAFDADRRGPLELRVGAGQRLVLAPPGSPPGSPAG